MTQLLEQAFNTVAGLPDEEQDKLARVMLQLAGLDQPPLQLTPDEEADLAESDAEIARGELATTEEIRAMWAKHELCTSAIRAGRWHKLIRFSLISRHDPLGERLVFVIASKLSSRCYKSNRMSDEQRAVPMFVGFR